MAASALLLAARLASLNLCTDEYLLLLAHPDEVASVSFLSQDPEESPLWKQARQHRSNRGSLEEVVGTRPNIVLTIGGGGRATSLIARRLGIRTIELRPAASTADVTVNLKAVASALGEPKRADPWLARLARLRSTAPRRPSDAIWLGGGGQSIGVPSMGAEWLRLAGLQQRPLKGDRVSLETLLVRPPTVLVRSRYRSSQVSQGASWLSHPIVRNAPSKQVSTDGRAWTCMGPLVIGEIEQLRARVR